VATNSEMQRVTDYDSRMSSSRSAGRRLGPLEARWPTLIGSTGVRVHRGPRHGRPPVRAGSCAARPNHGIARRERRPRPTWQGKPDEMANDEDHTPPCGISTRPLRNIKRTPRWASGLRLNSSRSTCEGLASRGWPVDAVSVHTYAGSPTNGEGLVRRTAELTDSSKQWLTGTSGADWFWDTETVLSELWTTRRRRWSRGLSESWRHGSLVRRYMWVQI
jgi:hypothetical protein